MSLSGSLPKKPEEAVGGHQALGPHVTSSITNVQVAEQGPHAGCPFVEGRKVERKRGARGRVHGLRCFAAVTAPSPTNGGDHNSPVEPPMAPRLAPSPGTQKGRPSCGGTGCGHLVKRTKQEQSPVPQPASSGLQFPSCAFYWPAQ